MGKLYQNAESAMEDMLCDGLTIGLGGIGDEGVPENAIDMLIQSGVKHLTLLCLDVTENGAGKLVRNGQVQKIITAACDQKYDGVEIEFVPQGTLVERLRAGGAGIAAFYTRTGIDTIAAEGKEIREFGGRRHVLEESLSAELTLIRATQGDAEGNLVYRGAARNSNPVMATCSRMTIAEIDEIVPAGQIDPDQRHTTGLYVQRLFRRGA